MDASTIATVVGSIAVAALTVSGTVLVARSRAKIDVSAAITSGFDSLTNQLQEERKELMETIRNQRAEIGADQTQMRKMQRHVDVLEAAMRRAGIDVPDRAD